MAKNVPWLGSAAYLSIVCLEYSKSVANNKFIMSTSPRGVYFPGHVCDS